MSPRSFTVIILMKHRVHDENAWALNGVAGHAGVFSTVDHSGVSAKYKFD